MESPLYNSAVRARHRRLGAAFLLLGATVPYAVAFTAFTYWPALEFSQLGTALAGLALVASALLPWLGQDRVALLGNRGLRHALYGRLQPEPVSMFVGFSPGGEVRSWEGETDQDVGFLELVGNTLVYRGDRHAFTLRRESLDGLGLASLGGPQTAAWGPVRIAVRWRAPGEPGQVFTLASREAGRLAQANRATRALAERLQVWLREGDSGPDLAPVLGPPPTDVRGSVPLDRPAPGSCLSALSLGVIALSLTWWLAGGLVREGLYNRAMLWAGLLVILALVAAAQVLAHLQAHEGRHP
jgi:hypothetical protein